MIFLRAWRLALSSFRLLHKSGFGHYEWCKLLTDPSVKICQVLSIRDSKGMSSTSTSQLTFWLQKQGWQNLNGLDSTKKTFPSGGVFHPHGRSSGPRRRSAFGAISVSNLEDNRRRKLVWLLLAHSLHQMTEPSWVLGKICRMSNCADSSLPRPSKQTLDLPALQAMLLPTAWEGLLACLNAWWCKRRLSVLVNYPNADCKL